MQKVAITSGFLVLLLISTFQPLSTVLAQTHEAHNSVLELESNAGSRVPLFESGNWPASSHDVMQNSLDFAIDLLVPARNSYNVGETPQLWARVINTGPSTIDPYELRGYFTLVSPSGSTIDAGYGDSKNWIEPGKIDLIENTDHAWTIPTDAEAGLYTLRVEINSIHTGVSRSGQLDRAFSINAPPAPDFTLSVSPTSKVISQGESTTFAITVNSLNGWAAPVSLSISGLPSDATSGLSTDPVTPTGTSTLSISTPQSTSTGQFVFVVTGTGDGRLHTTSATLIIEASEQPEFDFSISASQSSVTVEKGKAIEACTVTVSLTSGATGRVDLSLSGLPSNVGTYSFSPPYDNPPFTATLSIGTFPGGPTGDYTLTIIGSGGGKTRSTTLTLTVTAETPSGSFKPHRSSFVAVAVDSSIQASLGYENSLGEDVIVMFVISIASSGKVVDAPTAKAPDQTSGMAKATSGSLDRDTYHVSWWAFRGSDTSLSNPITWSTSDEIETVTIAGATRSAQMVAVSTDKGQYGVGEDVKISFSILNTGDAGLDLRVVVDIVDPGNNVVFDTHPVGQDKRHQLGPNGQASGEFIWTIPPNSACGTYRVEASLRDWNNWDTIFDYRWGEKPGPSFAQSSCGKPPAELAALAEDAVSAVASMEDNLIQESRLVDELIREYSIDMSLEAVLLALPDPFPKNRLASSITEELGSYFAGEALNAVIDSHGYEGFVRGTAVNGFLMEAKQSVRHILERVAHGQELSLAEIEYLRRVSSFYHFFSVKHERYLENLRRLVQAARDQTSTEDTIITVGGLILVLIVTGPPGAVAELFFYYGAGGFLFKLNERVKLAKYISSMALVHWNEARGDAGAISAAFEKASDRISSEYALLPSVTPITIDIWQPGDPLPQTTKDQATIPLTTEYDRYLRVRAYSVILLYAASPVVEIRCGLRQTTDFCVAPFGPIVVESEEITLSHGEKYTLALTYPKEMRDYLASIDATASRWNVPIDVDISGRTFLVFGENQMEAALESESLVGGTFIVRPTSVESQKVTQLFEVLDAYFSNTPSQYTDNTVPTEEDIFRLLDEYFEEE